MATRREYCAIIERMYDTHGVYVGGANGKALVRDCKCTVTLPNS